MVRATLDGLQHLTTARRVAKERGVELEAIPYRARQEVAHARLPPPPKNPKRKPGRDRPLPPPGQGRLPIPEGPSGNRRTAVRRATPPHGTGGWWGTGR